MRFRSRCGAPVLNAEGIATHTKQRACHRQGHQSQRARQQRALTDTGRSVGPGPTMRGEPYACVPIDRTGRAGTLLCPSIGRQCGARRYRSDAADIEVCHCPAATSASPARRTRTPQREVQQNSGSSSGSCTSIKARRGLASAVRLADEARERGRPVLRRSQNEGASWSRIAGRPRVESPKRGKNKTMNLLPNLARETGLEPATSAVTGRRSNQLSYSRECSRTRVRTRA